jgi:hypothetical protein
LDSGEERVDREELDEPFHRLLAIFADQSCAANKRLGLVWTPKAILLLLGIANECLQISLGG